MQNLSLNQKMQYFSSLRDESKNNACIPKINIIVIKKIKFNLSSIKISKKILLNLVKCTITSMCSATQNFSNHY